MRFRILVSKLGFLVRLLKKDEDLGSLVVLLLRDDFNKSCLVRECRELEDAFGTSQVRSKGNVGGLKLIKATIRKVDPWTRSRFWPSIIRKLPPLYVDMAKW